VAVHGRWRWLILLWFWSALGGFATIVIALAATAFGGREDWGLIEPINARPTPWLAAGAVLMAGLYAFAGRLKASGQRKVKWGRVKVEAIEATAEMTKYPIQPTPHVGIEIKLYVTPPDNSEAIIPKHRVSMQVRLVAEVGAEVSVRAPQRPAAGRPHPPNVYQDGEQVVIRGPGYLTMTGSLAVPVELEHSPPESIDVALRFRPIGGKRDKSHKLTLMQLKPAEEKTRRVEFRAQWGWRAIAPR
jgi:hypothetical protein